MSNPNRKMATLRQVTGVTPIEGADASEAVHVGGWVVVERKGIYHTGDYVIYMEPDTAMPVDNPNYAFLAERGTKTMVVKGVTRNVHVLRTIRLRGTFSQGILFRPEDLLPNIPEHAYPQICERKVDLSSMCGVCEYEPIFVMSADFLGAYDQMVGPQTDAERIQNVDEETFSLIKRTDSFFSVKVDGSSTTTVYDPRHQKVRFFSHRRELDPTKGIGLALRDAATSQGIVKWCEGHPGVSVQAELCGPKFNGNRLGLKSVRLFVFSLWDMQECRYEDPYTFDGGSIRGQCTPLAKLDISGMATTDLIEWVDGFRGSVVKDRLDEGVVIHVLHTDGLSVEEVATLRDALGPTMQCKAISRSYLAKAKE